MMKHCLHKIFLLILIIGSTCTKAQRNYSILSVPAVHAYTHIDMKGKSVLASGRYITPAGQIITITHDPFGMAISPDGTKTVTLHNGVFTIIDNKTLDHTRVPSYDKSIASVFCNGSFLGVAFSRDSKKLYLSGGDNGAVLIYDIDHLQRLD